MIPDVPYLIPLRVIQRTNHAMTPSDPCMSWLGKRLPDLRC